MNNETEQSIRFAEFEVDTAHRLLRRAGSPLALNAKAFDLLVYLAENAGRVVTKDEILDAVWENQFVEEANLKVQISALRKALGERRGEHRFLVTIPGKGYKFVADIENGNNEIVIEKHKVSRLVVEETDEEEEKGSEREAETGRRGEEEKRREGEKERRLEDSKISSTPPLLHSSSPFLIRSPSPLLLFFFAVSMALAVFAVYRYFQPGKASRLPFERVKLTRLTNSGKISGVTLSADGKFIAYVLGEAEGSSLWVR